jgi:translation elongation factor P/translation initiation factor 5A
MKESNRASSIMRRLRKGDQFDCNGELLVVTGFPERHPSDSTKVRVPVTNSENGTRSRRRTFNADQRVRLV